MVRVRQNLERIVTACHEPGATLAENFFRIHQTDEASKVRACKSCASTPFVSPNRSWTHIGFCQSQMCSSRFSWRAGKVLWPTDGLRSG